MYFIIIYEQARIRNKYILFVDEINKGDYTKLLSGLVEEHSYFISRQCELNEGIMYV